MKKIFLLSILLFQLTFVFGQVKTENKKGYGMATGDYKPNQQETPAQNSNINNSDRSYQNSCYSGFAFTLKNYGYSKLGNHYSWGIKVKNNYSKAVSLRYRLIVGNDNSSPSAKYGTLTYDIKPGETYTNDYGTMMALIVDSNSEQYRIEISDVCFEGQDCIKNGYADCNGKQSKTTNGNSNSTNSSNNSTNQTNNSNRQNTPQNDLSEYNRSKADLERQMAEKNAEIQRQNQENARLGQVWNNAIKSGVDSHNSGNYTEAKNQFTIAINNSSNETNRQNAQNYYNKSVEAEKNNNKIDAVAKISTSILTSIDQIAKINKEKKEEKESMDKAERMVNTIMDDKLYNLFKEDLIKQFSINGFEYKTTEGESISTKQISSTMSFNGFQIINIWTYINDYGMNKQLILTSTDEEVFKQLKSKKPYKKYLKSKDDFLMYSNKKSSLFSKEKLPDNCISIQNVNFTIKGINNIEKGYSYSNVKQNNEKKIELEKDNDGEYFMAKGAEAFEKKDYKTAKINFEKGVVLNEPWSMYMLGRMYANGFGVDKNKETAFKLYEKAAEKDNSEAMSEIASCFEFGRGIEKDNKKAVFWAEKAAEKGLSSAMYKLGGLYKSENNYEKAIYWYEKGAEKGNSGALSQAAYMQILGKIDPNLLLISGNNLNLVKEKKIDAASLERFYYWCEKSCNDGDLILCEFMKAKK